MRKLTIWGTVVVVAALVAVVGLATILVSPQPVSAAVVSVLDSPGLLTVTITGGTDDSVKIICASGTLKVNGATVDDPDEDPDALWSAVSDILVTGDDSDNKIDLSRVTYAAGFINGTAPTPTVNAGDGEDNVRGSGFDDTLNGEGGGNDIITGGTLGDEINGGPGNDTIDGGSGSDELNGCSGDDDLNGGAGSDTCINEGAGGTKVKCE